MGGKNRKKCINDTKKDAIDLLKGIFHTLQFIFNSAAFEPAFDLIFTPFILFLYKHTIFLPEEEFPIPQHSILTYHQSKSLTSQSELRSS